MGRLIRVKRVPEAGDGTCRGCYGNDNDEENCDKLQDVDARRNCRELRREDIKKSGKSCFDGPFVYKVI